MLYTQYPYINLSLGPLAYNRQYISKYGHFYDANLLAVLQRIRIISIHIHYSGAAFLFDPDMLKFTATALVTSGVLKLFWVGLPKTV